MAAFRSMGSGLVRGELSLIAVLLALAVVAWLVTGQRMAGMDGGPGTDPGTLGFYVSAWVLMMAAMMFPSIAPMVLTYRRIRLRGAALRGRVDRGATCLFVVGYLVAWTTYGVAAYGLFSAVQSLSIDVLSWERGGRFIAAGVILAAAAYQLTPAKDACLRRCRAPFTFLSEEWRSGRGGALVMGMLHGAWCVGCCWALMAALFAFGVMSVGWMIFVAALIAIEKLLPWKVIANRGVAVLLVALALAVAFVPGDVPGLTVPSSEPSGMRMDG
jgi:predicted metal-binding membrane protein